MVSICLFEDLHKPIAGKINALQLWIIRDIVDHADIRHAAGHFTRLRIHYDQSGRLPRGQKQTVIRFIKKHWENQVVLNADMVSRLVKALRKL